MTQGGDADNGSNAVNPDWVTQTRAAIITELNSATPIFVVSYYLNDQGSFNSTPTQVLVYYAHVGNIMVPIQSQVIPRNSGWNDVWNGVVFIGGVVFSLVGAPVISAEISALASGTTATATVGATTASEITTLATTTGQITGQADIGLIGKAVNLVNGNITSAATSAATDSGVSTVDDDIEFSDLASTDSPFDSFGFSSGESLVSYSDAMNTDFGLGTITGFATDPNDVTGFGATLDTSTLGVDDPTFSFNATPEVVTNDFGTTFDGPSGDGASGGSNWGAETTHTLIGAAPIAAAAAGSANNSNPAASVASAGGAGLKAVSAATGSNDVLSTVGNALKAVVGGTASQVTTAQNRTYTGQLGAAGGSTVGLPAGSMNTIALVGAGLVALALFMHLSGK